MKTTIVEKNGMRAACIESTEVLITDVRSALDLMMSVQYEHNCNRIAISKSAVTEDFFVLSSGIAGEILQKFINYHVKLVVWGDFSRYTSKPLRDFIYESNQGKDIFFMETMEAAMDRLLSVTTD